MNNEQNGGARDGRTRILMVVEATGGGVRRHLLDLLGGLDRERFAVGLVYATARADTRFLGALPRLADSVELFELPCLCRPLSPLRDARAFFGIVGAIRAFRPDVVHCHSSKAGALGRMAARLCGVKRIFYTPHAYSFQSPDASAGAQWLYRMIECVLSRVATTATINVSQGEKRCAMEAGLDLPEKFCVIPNGVEEAPARQNCLRKRLQLPDHATLVGCAARLDAQKDPITFLRVAALAAEERPGLRFVWIGDGPLEGALLERRDALGLQNTLLLPGFLPDADALVGEFDWYLSTALYEGMPYAPLEAMRAGVPVLATDVTGNNELVDPGKTGFLFPACDAKEAARLLLAELAAPTISPDAVRAAFEQRFTLSRMLAGIEALYLGTNPGEA